MNYIIDFVDGTTNADVHQYLQDNNITLIKTYNNYKLVFLVSSDQDPPITSIVEQVTVDQAHGIELQDTSYTVNIESEPVSINLTDNKEWWKIASVNVADFGSSDTFDIKKQGAKTTIYLIDSGIDITHPEFIGARIENLFSFNNNFTDTRGHGTGLASVMVGQTCGLSLATVKSVKIFDTNQATLLSDLLAAFDAVITDYLNNPGQAVVNLSWSIPRNIYIEDKINILMDFGIFVVASAGNNGVPIEDVTPAAMEKVITVGAYDQSFKPCNFSDYTGGSVISVTNGPVNHGALDFWAPGEQIWVAKLDGGYGYAAGTSLSAAITSSAIAYDLEIALDPLGQELTGIPLTLSNKSVPIKHLSRKDILILSDPYAESANITVIYRSVFIPEQLSEIDRYMTEGEVNMIWSGNTPICKKLFDPYKYKNIVITGDLPPGMSVSNGYLFGTVPLDSTKLYELHSALATVTDIDGNTKTVTLSITVVNRDHSDINTVPIPRSVLDSTFTIKLQGTWWGCDGHLYHNSFGCFDTGCESAGGNCINYGKNLCTCE